MPHAVIRVLLFLSVFKILAFRRRMITCLIRVIIEGVLTLKRIS